MNLFRLLVALLFPLVLQACSSSDQPPDGAALFKTCASCHQVGANARAGFGPELNGLFGRRAGTTPDYAYSTAMKQSGIVWDERTLSAFLQDPEKVVPDTKMRFWGMGDERERKALLGYLRSFQDAH